MRFLHDEGQPLGRCQGRDAQRRRVRWQGLVVLVSGLVAAAACAPTVKVRPRLTPALKALAQKELRQVSELSHTLTVGAATEGQTPVVTMGKTVKLTLLTTRALDRPGFLVPASGLVPLTHIKAFVDDQPLARKYIVRTALERAAIFLNDAHAFRIRFPELVVGQRIGYRASWRIKHPALLPFLRVPNVDYLKSYRLQVRHPPGMKVDFRLWRNTAGPAPTTTLTEGVSTLSLGAMARGKHLPYFPFNHAAAYVWPIMRLGPRALQPITPVDHARWYRGLFGKPKPLAAKDRQLVATLLKGKASPRDKVRALYNFARRKIRYIADERRLGGLVPRDAVTVLGRRWGDCKDKAYLLAELARQAGIKVDLVLVGVHERPPFGPPIHTAQFDHVIASYQQQGLRLFLDPTATDVEFGNLPEAVIERRALIVDGKASRLLRLPSPVRRPSLDLFIKTDVRLLAESRAEIIVRNDVLHSLRALQRGSHPDRLEAGMRVVMERHLKRIELSNIKIVSVGETSARLSAWVDLSRFFLRSPKRLYYPVVPFRVFDPSVLKRRGDAHPIYLPERPFIRLRIQIRKPGFKPVALPAIRLGDPGVAEFSCQQQEQGGQLLVSYRYQQKRKVLRGRARLRFLDFYERYVGSRTRVNWLEKAP